MMLTVAVPNWLPREVALTTRSMQLATANERAGSVVHHHHEVKKQNPQMSTMQQLQSQTFASITTNDAMVGLPVENVTQTQHICWSIAREPVAMFVILMGVRTRTVGVPSGRPVANAAQTQPTCWTIVRYRVENADVKTKIVDANYGHPLESAVTIQRTCWSIVNYPVHSVLVVDVPPLEEVLGRDHFDCQ